MKQTVCLLTSSRSVSGSDYLGFGVGKWSGGEAVLSSLHHSGAFPSFCVFVWWKASERAGRWNQEEAPRVNPKVPADKVTPTEKYTSAKHEWKQRQRGRKRRCGAKWREADSKVESPLMLPWEAPHCEGVGNAGRPLCDIGRGRQRRATRIGWMSGQHLLHLLAGSYQRPRCHTHWMEGWKKNEEEREEKRGHSLASLEKHASFCLPCKHKFGSLSGSRICISQSLGELRVEAVVVRNHVSTVCDAPNTILKSPQMPIIKWLGWKHLLTVH